MMRLSMSEGVAVRLYSYCRIVMSDNPRLRLVVGVSPHLYAVTIHAHGYIEDTNVGVDGKMSVWVEDALRTPRLVACDLRHAIYDAYSRQMSGQYESRRLMPV